MDSSGVQTRSILLSGVYLPEFLGEGEKLLKSIEREHPGVKFHLRDHLLSLSGSEADIKKAEAVVFAALEIARKQGIPTGRDVQNLSGLGSPELAVKQLGEPILTVRGRGIRPQTEGQREYVQAIENSTVTFGVGPAGTGKTYLAIAAAVRALQKREIAKIVLTRPAVEAGERLGYLPGSLEDKIDPYLRPLFDALSAMLDPDSVPRMLESGTIEVAPLAYMRGRTLNESFVILDEAQNTTTEQMRMFLTRLGYGSKMVVTGDLTQIDLPVKNSGLAEAVRLLSAVDDISVVNLTAGDIVRNELVSRIVDAYAQQ